MDKKNVSFWSPCCVFLEVSGPDSTVFLNRLSTRNLMEVLPQEIIENCFLSPKGRIIDVVCQFYVDNNKWLIMSSHDDSSTLFNWLNNYLFSEQVELKILDRNPGFDCSRYKTSEKYRIENLIPRSPNELNEQFNPLELGLGHLISWNKGCYPGQEVISKLDNYKKVSKQLINIDCTEAEFKDLKNNSDVTSCLSQFQPNQKIALAVIKKNRKQ